MLDPSFQYEKSLADLMHYAAVCNSSTDKSKLDTPEYELRFDSKTDLTNLSVSEQKITEKDFNRVFNNFRSAKFECQQKDLIRVGIRDENAGLDVRISVEGAVSVDKFSRNGEIENLTKTVVTKKQMNEAYFETSEIHRASGLLSLPTNRYDAIPGKEGIRIEDFHLAVHVQNEFEVPHDTIDLLKWDRYTKSFRRIRRFTWKHKDYPWVAVDMSVTKTAPRTANNVWDSNLETARENFEIEIEIDFPLFCDYVGKRAFAPDLLRDTRETVNKLIFLVLAGLQDTVFPMSYTREDRVRDEYFALIKNPSDRDPYLIGPNVNVLQFRNLVEPTPDPQPDILDMNKPAFVLGDDYTVSYKVDGLRHLLFVSSTNDIYLIDSSMRVKDTRMRMVQNTINWAYSVFDGELVMPTEEKGPARFYIFDAYFCGGTNIMGLPLIADFVDDHERTDRMFFADAFFKDCVVSNLMFRNQHPNHTKYALTILCKKFYHAKEKDRYPEIVFNPEDCTDKDAPDENEMEVETTSPQYEQKSIRAHIRTLFDLEADCSFPIDGYIFTPCNLKVGAASEAHPVPDTLKRTTWNHCLKWKQHNTIDFRVKFLPKDELVPEAYVLVNLLALGDADSYSRLLKTGAKETFEKEMNEVIFSDGSETKFLLKTHHQGQLICAKTADPISDGAIVEFSYITADKRGDEDKVRWRPETLRPDKTHGNHLSVARVNFNLTVSPITINTMYEEMTVEQMENNSSQSDGVYYLRGKSDRLADEGRMANFHNIYIKRPLIDSACKLYRQTRGSETHCHLLDLAVGKAGDLNHWAKAGITGVFGIDFDKYNIYASKNSACSRFLNHFSAKQGNIACLFAVGDTSKLISDLSAFNDVGEEERDANLALSYKVCSTLFARSSTNALRQLNYAKTHVDSFQRTKFQIASIQFALHYMFQNENMVNTIIMNMRNHLSQNGIAIATCFDGRRVARALAFDPTLGLSNPEMKYLESNCFSTTPDGFPCITIYEKVPNSNLRRKKFQLTGTTDRAHYERFANYDGDARNNINDNVAVRVFQDTIGEGQKEFLVDPQCLRLRMSDAGFAEIEAHTKSFEEVYSQVEDSLFEYDRLTAEDKFISFLNRQYMFRLVDANAVNRVRQLAIEESSANRITNDDSTALAKRISSLRQRISPRTSYTSGGHAADVLFVYCDRAEENNWSLIFSKIQEGGEFTECKLMTNGGDPPLAGQVVVVFKDVKEFPQPVLGSGPLLMQISADNPENLHPGAHRLQNNEHAKIVKAGSYWIRVVFWDPTPVHVPGDENPRGQNQFARLAQLTRGERTPSALDSFLDRLQNRKNGQRTIDIVTRVDANMSDFEVYDRLRKEAQGETLRDALLKIEDGADVLVENEVNEASRSDQLADDFMIYLNKIYSEKIRQNPKFLSTLTVLDYGCGEGSITSSLATKMKYDDSSKIFGADVRSLKKSNKFTFLLLPSEELQAPREDSNIIPLEDEKVDIVIASMALHHVRHTRHLLRDFKRVLKPGGIVIIREHDVTSLDFRTYLDILHGMYSLVWSKPVEWPRFIQEYEAFYRSKDEWTEAFGEAGFVHRPVAGDGGRHEKSTASWKLSKNKTRLDNPNHNFYSVFELTGEL